MQAIQTPLFKGIKKIRNLFSVTFLMIIHEENGVKRPSPAPLGTTCHYFRCKGNAF